jgi:hypothetical protein
VEEELYTLCHNPARSSAIVTCWQTGEGAFAEQEQPALGREPHGWPYIQHQRKGALQTRGSPQAEGR